MKSILLGALALFSFTSFTNDVKTKKNDIKNEKVEQTETRCKYKGKRLYRGRRGGCFYYNKNDEKTYVDRSYCDC